MGNHLIIDAYGCDKKKLRSRKFIERFLADLTEKINLKIIKGPVVLYHEARDRDESGVTGFVVLAESHISIHTFPSKGFFSLDIFACAEFNLDEIKLYLKKSFKIEKIKEFLIKREYEAC